MDYAVIYLRVSTDKQDEKSQLRACKTLCEERGYNIKGIFSDHSKSAYKTVYRPQYKQVMKLVYWGGGELSISLSGLLIDGLEREVLSFLKRLIY